MGFMTEISILNDAWHTIKEHPQEFIEKIDEGMRGDRIYARSGELDTSYGIAGYANPLTVYPSHHADVERVYVAGGNSFTALDRYTLGQEYGNRLADKDDFIHDVLLQRIEAAERMLKEAKEFVKEARANAVGQ